jgi:hypothetical protein
VLSPSCHRRENAICCCYTYIAGCFTSRTHSSALINAAADSSENVLAQVLNIFRIYLSSFLHPPFSSSLCPLPSSLASVFSHVFLILCFTFLLSFIYPIALFFCFFVSSSLPYSLTNQTPLFTAVILFSFLFFLENIFL